jgi:hypothetical protein
MFDHSPSNQVLDDILDSGDSVDPDNAFKQLGLELLDEDDPLPVPSFADTVSPVKIGDTFVSLKAFKEAVIE